MKKKNETLHLTKANIRKALQAFPPGSYGGIDWENVKIEKIRSENIIEVYIPLHLTTGGVLLLTELDEVMEAMRRSFGDFTHQSNCGLISKNGRTCFYVVYDIYD